MHRPRHRRHDPQRNGPIRNAGGAWRDAEPWGDPDEPEDDPVSSGVREGYRVIEEQIRRGRRMAQDLDDEPRTGDRHDRYDRYDRRDPYDGEPWRRSGYPEEPRSGYGDRRHRYGGRLDLLGMPMRHLGRLVEEILHQIGSARPDPLRLAGMLLELQVEAVSELVRLGFSSLGLAADRGDAFAEDARRVARDIDDTLEEIEDEEIEEEIEEEERWDWPVPPGVPTVVRSPIPIPVYVWSHEATEIEIELDPRERPLDLEVEPPLAVGTGEPPAPAFEADFIPLADGPVILRIEVPRELPPGRYPRRIVTRATGEPVGTLTVQVGEILPAGSTVSPGTPAKTSPAKTSPKAPPKKVPPKKPRPGARKP
jgi:hypothetical protein